MSKPKIRFKGYEEDWEQRKLPEFVTFFNGLTYTPDDVEETGTLVLRSSNVKNGEIVDADNVYVNDKVVTSENVQEGDIIVVVRNGSRALIGKHAQIKAPMPNTVIGAFMSGIRSEHSSFVNALLDTSAFENEIAKNMGATINQITGYMFSKMEFMIPSGEEQQKIGEYFQSFDDLITLHQRKCEETKKLKKYMLQKMFPQNGKRVPEIRFVGFTDDWEQRKVSEMFKVTRGYVLPATDTSQEMTDEMPYPVYSSQTKDNGLMGYYNDYLYEDAITWTTDGANAGTVNFRAGKFYCTNVCGVLLSDKIEASKVIAEALNNVAKRYVSYVGNPKLMNNVMADIQIAVPISKRERDQISSYFSYLDHLITLHQRQYQKLFNGCCQITTAIRITLFTLSTSYKFFLYLLSHVP